jgi:hypothetical protein
MPPGVSRLCADVQVLLLPNLGVQLPTVSAAPLQPLKLTHASSLAVYVAHEAAQYWRGLELLAQAPLLQPCATLDWEVGSLGVLDTMQVCIWGYSAPCARHVLLHFWKPSPRQFILPQALAHMPCSAQNTNTRRRLPINTSELPLCFVSMLFPVPGSSAGP